LEELGPPAVMDVLTLAGRANQANRAASAHRKTRKPSETVMKSAGIRKRSATPSQKSENSRAAPTESAKTEFVKARNSAIGKNEVKT
jgi:hypothetical protein